VQDPYVVVTTNSLKAERGVAPPIPPMEEFVLLEDVPQVHTLPLLFSSNNAP